MRRIPPSRQVRVAGPAEASPGRALLVLYIDDDKDSWEISYLALRRRFDLLWAKNAREAAELITEHQDDISAILIDIELQNSSLDGIQLTKLIRGKLQDDAIPPYATTMPVLHTPIFFVTAHGNRYSEAELWAVGGNKLIHKPVDFAQLSLALTNLDLQQMTGPAPRVLQEALKSDVTGGWMEQYLRTEPEFCARWVRLATHGLFAAAPPPSRGAPAEALIATSDLPSIRNAALTLAIADMLPEGTAGDVFLAATLRRAVTARLAGKLLAPDTDFFTLGMLMEAGLLARARHDLRGASEVIENPAATRTLREHATGEVDHPARGAHIARDWQLDAGLVRAVEAHHDTYPADDLAAKVAWVAERLAAVLESGDPHSNLVAALAAGERVGFTEAVVYDILAATPELVRCYAEGFGRTLPPERPLASLLTAPSGELAQMHRLYGNLVAALDAVVVEKAALARRLRRANGRLSEEAANDVLTGIANRRSFDTAIGRDLARADRAKTSVTLALVDIDRFKEVNDTYGHQVGDDVLRAVAAALNATLRTGDIVARYGGEEFAIIFPGTDLPAALLACERLRGAVEEVVCERPGGTVRVTASFGVAHVQGPGCAQGAPELLQRADAALYRAKKQGRNRVVAAA